MSRYEARWQEIAELRPPARGPALTDTLSAHEGPTAVCLPGSVSAGGGGRWGWAEGGGVVVNALVFLFD